MASAASTKSPVSALKIVTKKLTSSQKFFGAAAKARVGAKSVAGALGVCLHLGEIHAAVALLAGFYVAVAIVPWMAILLM